MDLGFNVGIFDILGVLASWITMASIEIAVYAFPQYEKVPAFGATPIEINGFCVANRIMAIGIIGTSVEILAVRFTED